MKRTIYQKAIYLIAGVFVLNTTITKAQNTTKDDGFKPSGQVWGQVIGDYYYKSNSDTLGRGGKNVQYSPNGGQTNLPAATLKSSYNAFQIRRAYLGYDYNISKKFSASVLLSHESDQSLDGANYTSYNNVYLKLAYLKWSNIFPKSDLIIGQQPTCSFTNANNTESLWGYRSSERTIMDMHNIDASTDLGIALQGKVWTSKSSKDTLKPTNIGYMLQVGNCNSGKAESDRFKKLRANVYVSAIQQKLTIGLYGDYNNTYTAWSPATVAGTGPSQNVITFKGYASFKTEWLSIGAEAFQQTYGKSDIYKTTATGAKNDTIGGAVFGWSVFVTGQIIKGKLNYFARIDGYNPDTKFNKNDIFTYTTSGKVGTYANTFYTQTFYNIGLDWMPIAKVHIMPNLWLNQYTSMASTDAATGKAITGRQKSDSDLVLRLTVNYIFGK